MRITRIALPLVATGGVAAALFGGGVVNTAFTSSATGSLNASTATIGTKITDGTVSLSNAIPGETGATTNVTVTNQGSTPETLSVSFGAGSNPALDNVVDVIWDGQDIGTLASLDSGQVTLEDGETLDAKGGANDSTTIPVALELDSSAGDSAADASDTVSYTITGTASSGNTPPPITGGGWNQVKNQQDPGVGSIS